MKKKIITLVLSMCFLLNSFFISSADSNNSKIVSRVAFGVIKEVGRIAVSTVLIGLDTYSLIDFGMYIYNSLTEEQQQELNDSYGTEEFEGKVLNSIDSLGQINSSYHFVPYIGQGIYDDSDVIGVGKNTLDNFEEYRRTSSLQGIKIDYTLTTEQATSWGTTWYYIYLCYRLPNDNNIYRKTIKTRLGYNGTPFIKEEVNLFIDNSNRIVVGSFDLDGKLTTIDNTAILGNINVNCENCPHNFDFTNPSYGKLELPTEEEKEYLKNNYPNYEWFDKEVSDDILGGGSEAFPPNNGDTPQDPPQGNSPIISNPPSFPNLEEFNFNGLQLQPLTDLFSNFKTKFPFSLPFDLANLIGGLSQDPIPPRFETEIFNYNFVIDFTEFEVLAQIVRAFTLLSYVVSLIFITRNFGG